jgi:uncharacterized lipoprotein YmbA
VTSWNILALAVAAGSIAGCASAEPTVFALGPSDGIARPGGPAVVELRRPGLAGYLDRSDVVARVADYRVRVLTNERWGEPLGDMIGRVLAEDLTERMPGTTIFSEDGAITADPDAIVEVDILRFDAGAGGLVILQAQVAVESGRSHAAASSRSFTLSARPSAGSTAAMAAAMSAVLGELADRMALLVRGA